MAETVSSSSVGQASLIGHTIGEYEVHALIGRGAMGTVYLAKDINLNRNVALKVLLGSLARNPTLVKRFHLEARAAAPLRHPNIVQVYSAGTHDGTPYIAMEFIEGEPLDRFIQRQGPIPWQTALFIGAQVAKALDCAHRHGVIHRDIKPANILLDSHGGSRLTDFGIANAAALEKEMAEANTYVGTPHYMSPEQCADEEVGPASDIYSLGVTLYVMMTGRTPFDADTPVALIKSITNDEPPRINKLKPEIPDDVARLVAHMMAKDAQNRPHNARSVIQIVERVQAEKGGQSAMPAALLSFMKEHTRIRPVRSLLKPGEYVDLTEGSKRTRPPLSFRAFATRLATAVITAIVFTGVPIIIQLMSGPPPVPQTSPNLEDANYQSRNEELHVVDFNYSGFDFPHIRWVGWSRTLLIQAVGKPGSLNHGATGLLAVDVESKRCVSVLTPASPATVANFWDIRVPYYGVPAPPCSTPGTVLDEAILLPEFTPDKPPEGKQVRIVARHWDETEIQEVVYTMPPALWNPRLRAPWAATTNGFAVSKPDGHTVLLVLNDPVENTNYLVERDVLADDPKELGPRLTAPGSPIVPSSVRYSPSGDQISYMRTTPDGAKELWVYSFERHQINGQVLAGRVECAEGAFSPDGSLIAFQTGTGADSRIRIVSTTNGMDFAEPDLGPGELGADPWHNKGTFIVATHGGRLWAIQLAPPYERMALTPENMNAVGGACITREGHWVSAVLGSGLTPSVVFVYMDEDKLDDLKVNEITLEKLKEERRSIFDVNSEAQF